MNNEDAQDSRLIPSSLDVFGESVRCCVEDIGRDFTEPDDDWIATLIVETEKWERYVFGLAGDLFNSEGKKDVLVASLQQAMLAMDAVRYAFVLSAWAIRGQKNGTEEEALAIYEEWRGHFGDHPERIEQLILHIVDCEQEFGWMAEIERYPDKPPTLGKWIKADEMSGRFPSLRDVLREKV